LKRLNVTRDRGYTINFRRVGFFNAVLIFKEKEKPGIRFQFLHLE